MNAVMKTKTRKSLMTELEVLNDIREGGVCGREAGKEEERKNEWEKGEKEVE